VNVGPRGPPGSAKILKDVDKICNFFSGALFAERDEIWHDEGHLCVAVHLLF